MEYSNLGVRLLANRFGFDGCERRVPWRGLSKGVTRISSTLRVRDGMVVESHRR